MRGMYNLLLIMIPSLEVCITLRQPSEILFVVAGVHSPFRGGKVVRPLTNPEIIEVILLILVKMVKMVMTVWS